MAFVIHQCPACGSKNLIRNGFSYECANCGCTMSNPSERTNINVNINKSESTHTRITRNDTEIEKKKLEVASDKQAFKYGIISMLILFVVGFLISIIPSGPSEVKSPYGNSSDCREKKVDMIMVSFLDAKFTDVKKCPLDDLDMSDPDQEKKLDLVDHVTIEGEQEWMSGFIVRSKKTYKSNSPVKIYYHSPKTTGFDP